MPFRQYKLGSYLFYIIRNNYRMQVHSSEPAGKDPSDKVKNYDQMLHQSLTKIFRGSRRRLTSRQIVKLIHNEKSVIQMILKHKPGLRRYFLEFKNLPLLWIAVLSSCHKSAELLVTLGADVNEFVGSRDPQIIDEKWTILHVLLQMYPSLKNERLIRLVVDRGADLQALDSFGRNVLHFVVPRNRVQLTETFLEKGVNVNVADDNSVTPLLAAAGSFKADELLPLLLKHGADACAKNRYNMNALHELTCSNVNHPAELIKELIERGVSLHERRKLYFYQPIHSAVLMKNNELVNIFLDHGADVNSQAYRGEFPLYLAATKSDNPEMLKILLSRGANVHQRRTFDGRTALHSTCEYAASYPKKESIIYEIIKILLSADADVFAEDDDGQTPFSLVYNRKRMKSPCTRLLLRTLALKKVCQPSIELKDERIIKANQELWSYYQDCHAYISRMKFTKIIESCTFFELLTKNRCQIAALMRNRDFGANFELYDLSGFSTYSEDLLEALERARNHYHAMLKQEDVINEAVHYMLPYVVVRKVVRYVFDNCCKNVKCK